MRIDAVTIFPEYLEPLRLSLIGKAHDAGVVDLRVHDLRHWTTDRHRTVDDTPLGGGAGMVMKPDVWGAALDELLDGDALGRTVLAIPTPSGTPFTQRTAEYLAGADHIIIACGRYEGIDARVAEHYSERVEVLEYSLGDYVLNGGEAAALVLTEAVVRLLPGVLGNPESLAEESHGADGLLEYPVYTRPVSWRSLDAPEVLLSGNHAAIARWRRDRALERTASRRPDMLAAHTGLASADAPALGRHGLVPGPRGVRNVVVRTALLDDVGALADLAAETFPLACPEWVDPESIAVHVAAQLSPERFGQYIASDRYIVTVAETDGVLAGYTLSVLPGEGGGPDTPEEAAAVIARPVAELSKIYVREGHHRSGLAGLLMVDAIERLAAVRWHGEPLEGVWLGTNAKNARAIRFYKKSGFAKVGSRSFHLADRVEHDSVFYRPYVD